MLSSINAGMGDSWKAKMTGKFRETSGNFLYKGKGKVKRAPQESIGGAHLPLPGLQPIGGEPLMSVTYGQCDTRLTVTFPAAACHRPLAGTKL